MLVTKFDKSYFNLYSYKKSIDFSIRLDKIVKELYNECIRSPRFNIYISPLIKPHKVKQTCVYLFIKLYKVRGDWQDSPLPSSQINSTNHIGV